MASPSEPLCLQQLLVKQHPFYIEDSMSKNFTKAMQNMPASTLGEEGRTVIKPSFWWNYQALTLEVNSQNGKLSLLDNNVRDLSEKVNRLSTANLNPVSGLQDFDAHLNLIATELTDRTSRASNVLTFNLWELSINSETDDHQCDLTDHQAAFQLISSIHNISDNIVKVKRLGRDATGKTRLLLVSLSPLADALAI